MFTKPGSVGVVKSAHARASASHTTQKACQKPLPPLPQPWGRRVRGQGLGKASTHSINHPAACLGILVLNTQKVEQIPRGVGGEEALPDGNPPGLRPYSMSHSCPIASGHGSNKTRVSTANHSGGSRTLETEAGRLQVWG